MQNVQVRNLEQAGDCMVCVLYPVSAIIHLLTRVDYLPVHKPSNNLDIT